MSIRQHKKLYTGEAGVTNLSASCIDHIFIKNIKINNVNSYILRCDITDHYATILTLSDLYTNENVLIYTFKSDMINTSHLDLLIKTENWYSCLDYENVDIMIEVFNSKLKEFVNYSVYTNIMCKSKKMFKIKEWIITGIIISIRNRQKLYAKLRTRPFDSKFRQYYICYRNICIIKINYIVHNQIRNRFGKLLTRSQESYKNTSKINRIINKGGIVIASKVDICNELNTFFVNVGSNLEIEHFINSDKFLFNINIIEDNIFFKQIDAKKSKHSLQKLRIILIFMKMM
ncbi:RNA-directed DNA polymerase from mobile element jockey [Aphis craccivora]|uniref:RNA-directed DNA polymerase from mobile element jockey n=1 Tax=Aphis craccivora TaxID=307492 RepID=A0A6G0YF80_APHCR|nr:RNA-directed DNA polymerase from mobile element jockey [Aphis craccivora]